MTHSAPDPPRAIERGCARNWGRSIQMLCLETGKRGPSGRVLRNGNGQQFHQEIYNQADPARNAPARSRSKKVASDPVKVAEQRSTTPLALDLRRRTAGPVRWIVAKQLSLDDLAYAPRTVIAVA